MKKEIQRRKKQQQAVMQTQMSDMEDKLMQGVIYEKIKSCSGMTSENLKEYLRVQACPNAHANVAFSPYWKTFAVGLLKRVEKGPNTHLILFSNRTSKNENVNMAVAYCSAWLMAS